MKHPRKQWPLQADCVTSVTHAITVVTPSACDARNTSRHERDSFRIGERWWPLGTRPLTPHLFIFPINPPLYTIPLTFIHIYFSLTHSSSQLPNFSYKYLQYLSSYTTSFQQTTLSKSFFIPSPPFNPLISMARNQQFGNIIFRSEDDNYQREQFERFQQQGGASIVYLEVILILVNNLNQDTW